MKLIVFFRKNFQQDKTIRLVREEISHLKAFRIHAVDKLVEIRDGIGNGTVYNFPPFSEQGVFIEHKKYPKKEQSLEIAIAIPRKDRLEVLIEKGTELGVDKFHFITFKRSDKKTYSPDRLEKIIHSAGSQSGRTYLPELKTYDSLVSFLEKIEKPLFYLDMEKTASSLFPKNSINQIPIIGSEGGFSPEEKEILIKNNILCVYAGSEILKVETAGLYAISIIKYSSLQNGIVE